MKANNHIQDNHNLQLPAGGLFILKAAIALTVIVAATALALLTAGCGTLIDSAESKGLASRSDIGGSTTDPSSVPRVILVNDAGNILTGFTKGTDTYNRRRLEIAFNTELDESSVTTANIYTRDVEDTGTNTPEVLDALIKLLPSGRDVVLDVDLCTSCGASGDNDTINELVVTKSVMSSGGNALRGNAICDANYCPAANDYRNVINVWAGGNPPPAGTAGYTPTDISYNLPAASFFTGIGQSGTTINITANIADYDNAAGSLSASIMKVNGIDANGITFNANSIDASFTGLSENTLYEITFDSASNAFQSAYTYPNGDVLGASGEKLLFVDRMNGAWGMGPTGESNFTINVWTQFTSAGVLRVNNVTATLTAYVYVGGETTSLTGYTAVALGNGDYTASFDSNGNQVAKYVGPGNGDYINTAAGGNGNAYYNGSLGTPYTMACCGDQYQQVNNGYTITFNGLVPHAGLTSATIKGYTTDGNGDLVEAADLSIFAADSDTVTTVEIRTGSSMGLAGFKLLPAIVDDAGNCLDGNDGADATSPPAIDLDSDTTLQCKTAEAVDSNNNGRIDDAFYFADVPDGL